MNLFDGINGKSDGIKNGYSSTLPSGVQNISVHGTFDGATVTLSRYSKETDSWFKTKAIWTESNVFQGLDVSKGARYRLELENASSKTNLVAEV